MFIFSSSAPDPLLEGAGLESDRVGSRPNCGHPAEATELLTWMGQDLEGCSSKEPFEVQTFPFLKRREIEMKTYCSVQTMFSWIKEGMRLIKGDSQMRPSCGAW